MKYILKTKIDEKKNIRIFMKIAMILLVTYTGGGGQRPLRTKPERKHMLPHNHDGLIILFKYFNSF